MLQNTCLGNMIESHLKRWLVIATAISLIIFGTLIIFYEIVRPSRLNTLTIVGYVLATMLALLMVPMIFIILSEQRWRESINLKASYNFGAFLSLWVHYLWELNLQKQYQKVSSTLIIYYKSTPW